MKRSAKFLSVLLVMALCVSFVPAAYALDNAMIGESGPTIFSESHGPITTVPTSPEPEKEAETSPSPLPTEEVKETEEPEDSKTAISVATAAELRQALTEIAFKGTITVTADIEDLTAPLVIGKSVTIDLDGNTLTFVPAGAVQNCAVYVAEDVEFVNIINGQIEIGSETDKDEKVSGYASGIVSNAGWLGLNELDIRGTLAGGSMLVKENEDGDLVVMCGVFMSDPSAFVNDEEYTVEKTEDGWKVSEIEEAEPTPAPTPSDEPTDEPADDTPAEPTPSPETPAEPSVEPSEPSTEPTAEPTTTPESAPGIPIGSDEEDESEGEENDSYTDDLMLPQGGLGLGQFAAFADGEERLSRWAANGSDAPVLFTNDIELKKNLDVEKDLTLDLAGKKLTGTGILVTNVAELSLNGGAVEAKINNTGKLNLTGVTAQEVNSSGSVSLMPGASVEKLTVSSGEAVVDASEVKELVIEGGSVSLTGDAKVGSVTIEGGSISLTGTADVKSMTMTGGALNVQGSDGVTVGIVSVEGDVEININSGTFQGLVFGGASFYGISAASEPEVHLVSGTKVTGGTFAQIDEAFIAEGYTLNENNGIMLLSMSGSVGFVDGEQSNDKSYSVYYKGTAEELKDVKEPKFELKITNVTESSTGVLQKIVAKRVGSSVSVDLVEGTDYTYSKNNGEGKSGGTVELNKGGANLQKLAPGYYQMVFDFGETLTNGEISERVFVFPRFTYTDVKYVMDSGDNVTFSVGGTDADKPQAVSFAAGSDHERNEDTLLAAGTDYTLDGTTLTVNDAALAKKATTAGSYYLGLWYADGHHIYVRVTVREKPSASPSSQNWAYNGGDVTVTVYSAANKATSVTGPAPGTTSVGITSSDYSISENGRTVTIKGDYLRRLVDTETGNGHGVQTFTIVTEDGNVPATINIRPALWPRNNEDTHRKGSDADLIFDCSAPIDPNYAPTLGTKSISADDADGYTIKGNTITLKAAFLNKRASQDWTLGVTTTVADHAVAYANFKVTGTSSGGTGVATGDENNAVVWAVVLVLSGAAVVALIPKKKKQQGE